MGRGGARVVGPSLALPHARCLVSARASLKRGPRPSRARDPSCSSCNYNALLSVAVPPLIPITPSSWACSLLLASVIRCERKDHRPNWTTLPRGSKRIVETNWDSLGIQTAPGQSYIAVSVSVRLSFASRFFASLASRTRIAHPLDMKRLVVFFPFRASALFSAWDLYTLLFVCSAGPWISGASIPGVRIRLSPNPRLKDRLLG